MRTNPVVLNAGLAVFLALAGSPLNAAEGTTAPSAPARDVPSPEGLDLKKAEAEVARCYGKAHPEIQEYVLWTARQFGRSGLWLNEDAFAALPTGARDERVQYLVVLFADAEYGRHLCSALAEASALKDPRLVPGLERVAGYHQDDRDYDCRAKWMAVAALARQEAPDSVPLLISLADHGNQNTRFWARAALARITGQDFKQDKLAWAKWWESQGHPAVDPRLLEPWKPPTSPAG